MRLAFSRVDSVLAAVCLTGAIALYVASSIPTNIDLPPGINGGNESPPFAIAKVDQPDEKALSVIKEKPLFNSTRRPVVETSIPSRPVASPAPPPPPPTPPPSDLELQGVIMDRGEGIALIRVAGRPDVIDAKSGENVAGWKIVKIASDHIQISSGQLTKSVVLVKPSASPPGRSAQRPVAVAPRSPGGAQPPNGLMPPALVNGGVR